MDESADFGCIWMKWEVYMDIRGEGAEILGVYMDESSDLGCI